MKEQKLFGKIYKPGQPDKCIEGVWLYIKEDSIIIEGAEINPGENRWPILLGEFTGLDEVTFINCRGGESSFGSGGARKNIHVAYLVKGYHAQNESDLMFDKIILDSPALTKWIHKKEHIKFVGNNTYVVPLSNEVINTDIEGANIKFKITHLQSFSYSELHVNRLCVATITFPELVSIVEVFEVMRHIKKFILFCTNEDPDFSGYTVFRDGQDYELVNTSKHVNGFTQNIQIYYHKLSDNLHEIIKKWFEYKELYPVIDLVLERTYNGDMSVDGYFISTCMAIEIFQHAFGKKNEEILDNLTLKSRERITQALSGDEKLQKWFIEKAQYWSNPTLKDRLMEYKQLFDILIKDVFDMTVDEFIKRVVKARNRITHSGTYEEHFSHIQLFMAAKILELTLRLKIMELMGIDITKSPDSFIDNAKASAGILVSMNKSALRKEVIQEPTKESPQK